MKLRSRRGRGRGPVIESKSSSSEKAGSASESRWGAMSRALECLRRRSRDGRGMSRAVCALGIDDGWAILLGGGRGGAGERTGDGRCADEGVLRVASKRLPKSNVCSSFSSSLLIEGLENAVGACVF